jgi:OFA family oxalate/formate antiporter-like MFS transporter
MVAGTIVDSTGAYAIAYAIAAALCLAAAGLTFATKPPAPRIGIAQLGQAQEKAA